jgi:hypothetical protein
MLTLTYKTTRITCTEANAPKYRALIDADKPIKFKKPVDRRFDCMRRHYPKFYAGLTTTADYVREYASINDHQHLIALEYTHADRLAPMLDPTAPEVLEELDADYVPTVKQKITPKKALQMIAAIEPDVNANVHDLWLAFGEVQRIVKAAS